MCMAISEQIAHYVNNIKFDNLPANVVEQAKACLLDWLGCAWSGSQTSLGNKVIDFSLRQEKNGSATIIATGKRTSAWGASFANGFNAHIDELDDVYEGSYYHPGVAAIAAALAVAETENCSGKELICAIVAGYEVGIRIALAINPSHYEFWHTTGTVGTFAAATAAGKLMNLNIEELIWALGNAGTQAAGLWQFAKDGAMSKPLHPGKAALGGVIAAYLAKAGMTGAKYIFEGEKGFCRATSQHYNLETITSKLGTEYHICGISPKPFASCFYSHPAIKAGLIIRGKLMNRIEEISKVEIWTDRVSAQVAGLAKVNSSHEAKLSIGFCFALSIICGKVGRNEFAKEMINDQHVREIFERSALLVEPSFSEGFPQRKRCKIIVFLRDGMRIIEQVDTQGRQVLSSWEVRGKLLDVVGMPTDLVTITYEKVQRLQDVEEMADFFDFLQ